MEDQVKQIIATQIGIEPSDIGFDMCLVEDLNADSLDTVEIIMDLERKFNIEIDTEEANTSNTLRKILLMLEKKLQK